MAPVLRAGISETRNTAIGFAFFGPGKSVSVAVGIIPHSAG
jgi:hypothetical protein